MNATFVEVRGTVLPLTKALRTGLLRPDEREALARPTELEQGRLAARGLRPGRARRRGRR